MDPQVASAGASGILGLANTGLNAILNIQAEKRQNEYNKQAAAKQQEYNEKNMALSYQYGEQAAQNADARTRALYNDMYSPQATTTAQMQALQENGLSPALMYGGAGIGSGSSTPSGAQGGSPGAASTPVAPNIARNPLANAQLDLTFAQVAKTLAEAKAIGNKDEREEGKFSAELQVLESTIADIKEGIKNKQVLRKLTNLQAESIDLDNFIKEMTTPAQIQTAFAEAENIAASTTNILQNNEFFRATEEEKRKQLAIQTTQMQLEAIYKSVEIELAQANISLTNAQTDTEKAKQDLIAAQTDTEKERKKLTMEQIKQTMADTLLKAAEMRNLDERTKFIEKEFKLKKFEVISNTVIKGISTALQGVNTVANLISPIKGGFTATDLLKAAGV